MALDDYKKNENCADIEHNTSEDPLVEVLSQDTEKIEIDCDKLAELIEKYYLKWASKYLEVKILRNSNDDRRDLKCTDSTFIHFATFHKPWSHPVLLGDDCGLSKDDLLIIKNWNGVIWGGDGCSISKEDLKNIIATEFKSQNKEVIDIKCNDNMNDGNGDYAEWNILTVITKEIKNS